MDPYSKLKKVKETTENMAKTIASLENDILDSFAFIELINALNDEFDIEIQPTQVKPTTWRTVKGIVQMVEELQNEAK